MEKKNFFEHPAIATILAVLITILMIGLVFFTIYIQQPDPIEINMISFAGRETISTNNKPAIDLISWAPGYTDQTLLQIDNNTKKDIIWNIKFDKTTEIKEDILNSIDVYIKENPTSRDVLNMYNSPITDGYSFIGSLSDIIKKDNVISKTLSESVLNLSILFHVREDSEIAETKYLFEDFIKVSATSENYSISKIFK